jgi:hypothetical protein
VVVGEIFTDIEGIEHPPLDTSVRRGEILTPALLSITVNCLVTLEVNPTNALEPKLIKSNFVTSWLEDFAA